MSNFRPSPPEQTSKGWFGWSTSQSVVTPTQEDDLKAAAEPTTGSGLIATLRNVFVPSPNPDLAPAHPVDPISNSPSPASSISEKKKSGHLSHKKTEDKLSDYINTLEISSPDNAKSKEAVVVLHGYAAAMG